MVTVPVEVSRPVDGLDLVTASAALDICKLLLQMRLPTASIAMTWYSAPSEETVFRGQMRLSFTCHPSEVTAFKQCVLCEFWQLQHELCTVEEVNLLLERDALE